MPFSDSTFPSLISVPSGEPRNITISNITEHSVTIQWLQIEAAKLNGIFRRFKILINETLVDASKGIWREYFADRDNIFDISNGSRAFPVKAICNITEIENNSTLVLDFDNTTGIFSLSFVGLRPFTNYSISITSCTEPGCGYPSIINIRTEESCKLVQFCLVAFLHCCFETRLEQDKIIFVTWCEKL